MTMAVTLRAGPGEYSMRLVKRPGAIDSRYGSDASGVKADPSNRKNATCWGLPFCTIAISFCFRLGILIGVVVDVLVDRIVEVLGLLQLPAIELVSGHRLHVELNVVLRQPLAQRVEIVGEVVKDAEVRSEHVHRHARVRRERAQVLHDMRLHLHLIFGQRIERVDDDRGDGPRRPGEVL